MLIEQILSERVVNAFDPALKSQYAQEVWDMLQKAYASIGGFHSSPDIDDLVHNTGLWKLVKRDGHLTTVSIYKDKFGRKGIAVATDGSTQGKRDYSMLLKTDMIMGRCWMEVSGSPEKLIARLGSKPLPAKYAKALIGKDILEINPDGFHYTRMIGGTPHEKIIYGMMNPTEEEQEQLRQAGIEMHELKG